MKLASGFCPVDRLQNAGVNVALGTDGSASNNDLDMFGEMRSAAILAKAVAGNPEALSAHKALQMATLNGAKALGIDAVVGSLEVGKQADLTAMSMNALGMLPLYNPVSQLVYCNNSHNVSHVWVKGRNLLNEGRLMTLNEDEIIAKALAWGDTISAQTQTD
jgi:5-methylthioadenosine/S-adenosylhomocysteine deaminase